MRYGNMPYLQSNGYDNEFLAAQTKKKETVEKMKIQKYKSQYLCEIHLEDCEGSLITKKSIYGAIVRGCHKAWTEPIMVGQKLKYIDPALWPEEVKD